MWVVPFTVVVRRALPVPIRAVFRPKSAPILLISRIRAEKRLKSARFPSPLNPLCSPPPVYSLYRETIMRWVYVYKMLAETTESWKNNTACTRLFS